MGRLFRALPMIKTQQAAIYKRRLAVRDINADTGEHGELLDNKL